MFSLTEAVGLVAHSYSSSAVPSLVAIAVLLVPLLLLSLASPADISDELRRTHRRLGGPGSDLGRPRTQRPDVRQHQAGRAARIHSIHVYPVKSCRGIQLPHSAVVPKGLEHDRLFTFAARRRGASGPHEPEWEIATLRQLPLLANVRVDLWLPRDDNDKTGRARTGGLVVITFPPPPARARARADDPDAGFVRDLARAVLATSWLGRRPSAAPPRQIVLPLDFPSPVEIARKAYRYEEVQFFGKSVEALHMAGEVPPELAAYLGARGPMTLFRMDPARRRGVFGNAPRKEVAGFQPVVDFQDQYPLHLLSLSSVRALEAKIRKDDDLQALDPQRFRPNIIISGLPEYDEDDWRIIQARGPKDAINFDVSCRTVRCKLPNVDPATGIRHKLEPDHSLRKHREIDGGAPKKGCFGMQLCPLLGDAERGVLEVGMEIHVVQRGPHFAL